MTFTYVFTYFLVTLVSGSVSIVLLTQLATDMGTEQEVRAFRNYVVWTMLFMFSNSIWIWINYGYLNVPGDLFSIVNLVAICVASYYWFKYIELRVTPERVETRAFRIVSIVPLTIAVALIVTTPFTQLVFHYTAENQYIHGPLYSTMAVLAILYLVAAGIDVVIHLRQAQTPLQRRQYLVLALFLIFPVLGGVIDIIIPNLPVMELMLLFGTVLVYTNMQQSRIYNDVLTGLNNRRLADEYLLEHIELATKDDPLYLFMGDANRFKGINDRFGHTEGDQALKLFAEGLKDAVAERNCHVARWGGDEFVIIGNASSIGDPAKFAKHVDHCIAKVARDHALSYPLELSIGYAACTDPHTTPAEMLAAADKMMYDAKRASRAITQ